MARLFRSSVARPSGFRVEHQLGYKMAEWLNRIELVEDFPRIARAQGGWRDERHSTATRVQVSDLRGWNGPA